MRPKMWKRIRRFFRRAPAVKVHAEEERFDNDQLPASFRCPITQDVFLSPVVASDGYTYEKQALLHWFADGNFTSPMTRARLNPRNLHPNRSLKAAIEDHKKLLRRNAQLEAAMTEIDGDDSTQSTWRSSVSG